MQIGLYNTLTRRVEHFEPIDPSVVRIYSCGPTVYNMVHVGNHRSFLFADLLQRTLRVVGGYKVQWVMNITDIDDKIIRDSAFGSTAWKAEMGSHTGDSMKDLVSFTRYWEKLFLEDIASLGIRREHFHALPRATEYIDQMQGMIRKILKMGYAYIRDGSIYFSVEGYRKDFPYGRLYNIDESNFRQGVRIDADEYDRDSVSDFVLWKSRRPGEPFWNFAIDEHQLPGRPGWHIECSAMSKSLLGIPFDIHTGGVDLRFPHHEDELAQCTACDGEIGHEFIQSRFWVHNEFLEVDGAKMSKSLNNFYTVQDLKSRGFHAHDIRLSLMLAHYRSVLNFTFDSVTSVSKARARVQSFIWDLIDIATPATDARIPDTIAMALSEDLNTPKALAALYQYCNDNAAATDSATYAGDVLGALRAINDVFGVWTFTPRPLQEVPANVQAIAERRWQARINKDWTEADKLRIELSEMGWNMKDGHDEYTLEPRQPLI